MTWRVPTIAGIQGAAAVMTAALGLFLLATVSPAAALGCAVGGANRLGIVAAPLKLLFIVTIVAWLLSRTNINVPGFVLGALTQPGAIFIETWRVSARTA